MRMHMQSDFTRSATQGQPELVLYHYILESVKLWDKSLTWHKVLMHPLKSDHVSSVYLHFPFIQTVLFNRLRDISKVWLCYTAGVFIIVKAKFRWTKPFENVMHLYLPTRLYCLSLLLDQKLQVPSVETFLLYITVKSIICQLKYFISVFLAAFVTITWYVNGHVHLMMAFLSLLVNFHLLIIHSKGRDAAVLKP